MTDYNASDTRQIRAAAKREKQLRDQDDGFLLWLMTNPAGRSWMWRFLGRCHSFSTPFTGDNNATNFQCGEQNIGLELISDLTRACPDQFIFMMREAHDVEHRHDNGSGRPAGENGGRDDSRPIVDNYDDADDTADASAE